jgi:PAS domain S-box-containing protein
MGKQEAAAHEVTSPLDAMQVWRQQLIQNIVRALTIPGFLALVVGSYSDYLNRLGRTIPFYVGAYAAFILVAFWRRTPYILQAGVLLALIYGLGVVDLFNSSLSGDSGILFLTFSAMTTLLLGRRRGIFALALCIVTLVAFGGAYSTGLLAIPVEKLVNLNTDLSWWLNSAVALLMLSALLVLSQSYLVRHLLTAFTSSHGLTRALRADIAERKRVEQALRESEEKFRNIVEQASDAILLCDEQGVVAEWNRAAEQMTGLSAADVLGRFYWDVQFELVPKERRTPDVYEQLHSIILQALENGHAHWFRRPLDGELQCPDGTHRYFQQTVFPIQTVKGVMVASITRDLTERVQAEKEREKLFRELEEALARVKTLSGLLPICASCKKIRDDRGDWHELEVYVRDHSDADFSHGICPECAQRLYPSFFK